MKRSTQSVLEAQDVVDLNTLFEQLGGIDLGKLNTEKEKKELVERLATDPTLRRNKPGKTGLGRTPKRKPHGPNCSGSRCTGCGPSHWRHRRKKNNQWYAAVGKPRRDAKKAESLKTPEGWYEHITHRWKQMKIEHFTYEEFLETFWPMIRDDNVLPTFRRYNTRSVGFTVGNVYVINVRTTEVVYDSAEERLRSLGAIL